MVIEAGLEVFRFHGMLARNKRLSRDEVDKLGAPLRRGVRHKTLYERNTSTSYRRACLALGSIGMALGKRSQCSDVLENPEDKFPVPSYRKDLEFQHASNSYDDAHCNDSRNSWLERTEIASPIK